MTNWDKVAATTLRMCKDIDPLFYSQEVQSRMARGWGIVMSKSGLRPADIYEGVTTYYASAEPGDRPSVGSILQAARKAVQVRELCPDRREEVIEQRRKREQERDEALKNGTWTPKGVR